MENPYGNNVFNIDLEEMERRLEFHERKMNDPGTPKYWRKKSEDMYWYYLNILTSP